MLLALALQRRFDTPYAQLLQTRLLAPLGMTSTVLPVPRGTARGQLAGEFRRRAVQGYNADGKPVGEPGNEQGPFNWPGTGQIYSSTRDMARFLAANLGALPDNRELQEAMALAQEGVFTVNPRFTQALAWQLRCVVRGHDDRIASGPKVCGRGAAVLRRSTERQGGSEVDQARAATRTGSPGWTAARLRAAGLP